MTTEEKAQAYDKAFERAKKWYYAPNSDKMPTYANRVIEEIFPELAESEDEKIKKEIAELVMQPTWKTEKEFHRRKELCDWLEKQPAWSEEDERMFDYALDMIEWYSGKNGDKSKLVSDWFKSLKDRVQPQNWTKEDKERYISCLQRLSTGNPEQPETINSKWFKEHVYPQKQWKPSYEQMDSLEYIIDNIQHLPYSCSVAKELLEQLKKIKGE